ncbi:hypothetical protein FGG78_21710 [Thioclava sp. BHET1]|nr:hypothetical protein FGG78_21710 [Thioclava sp. BHET1]
MLKGLLGRGCSFLERNVSIISSISAIASSAAIVIGAWQVYSARTAIEAQSLSNSLGKSRDFLEFAYGAADEYSKLLSVDPDTVRKSILVNMEISGFSEQFYLYRAGVIPGKYWVKFKSELCEFVRKPMVSAIVDANLSKKSYPDDFSRELRSCG